MRIGIDLGGTKTEGVLMDVDGSIVKTVREPTPANDGYAAILSSISAIVHRLEQEAGMNCRVGIGTPGATSPHNGLLRNSNTVCLNGKSLQSDLEARLDRPVRLDNDANCFALSEAVDGAGTGAAVVFGIIMGTGVGGGIVVNRKLVRGAHHIGGEWGHNTLLPDGPPCYCGRNGCVETLLSGPGLIKNYRDLTGISFNNARELIDGSRHGHAGAEQAIDRFLDHFGRAVATVINILDPDIIVIGGGLSNFSRLYNEGRDRVATHVFSDYFDTPIVKNRHGDSSGVRGAAWLWPATDSEYFRTNS